ncbi:hypothetical protein, partial [uncultured Subdoligranulum sp.]|uniref:hypothetical protein n=1 Tax=uncultured Subdoligranulum sp. TaxID=512298 RepID=UPI0025DC8FCA
PLYRDCLDNFHFTGALMACLSFICFCELDYTLSFEPCIIYKALFLVNIPTLLPFSAFIFTGRIPAHDEKDAPPVILQASRGPFYRLSYFVHFTSEYRFCSTDIL